MLGKKKPAQSGLAKLLKTTINCRREITGVSGHNNQVNLNIYLIIQNRFQ